MVSILVVLTLFAVKFVDFTVLLNEDAAILMRHAVQFAHGHGIVWNIGEQPVDGATDFLFMVLVGLLVRAGMTLEFATRPAPAFSPRHLR